MSRTAVDIVSIVRDAGIVGAGGAGFPTHVKLGNAVDTVIANGAECEPILEADKHLMEKNPGSFIRGMEAAMEQVGARKGIIGIKNKNTAAIDAVSQVISGKPEFEIGILENSYPAGDELVLIRDVTGKTVPQGGLPFMIGVTVSNVATFKQISDALDGKVVTSRNVTIGGEVARPVTVEVPIGTPVKDLIAFAGGVTVTDYEIILGGPIMGPIGDTDDVIDKRFGGVIVLPKDHTMVRLKKEPVRITKQRAKMCCTCQECTILCPRNAIGHAISPAKMMSYSWFVDEIIRKIEAHDLDEFTKQMVFESILCCQCGVCEQYACIFGLAPNKVYAMVRDAIKRSGLKYDFSKMPQYDGAMFNYRKLPALTYARKLGLERYLGHTEFEPLGSFIPGKVRIPLLQHIGAPAKPVVKQGESVKTGDLIGEIPENGMGARVHASIHGHVEEVTNEYIVIRGAGS
ncbi:MAG: SLBB domain-containing protein [Candidatus Latescibacteria bacterium]|nr:SLBB domain-containing protein [Candidatus Latescibacterota bacterium]